MLDMSLPQGREIVHDRWVGNGVRIFILPQRMDMIALNCHGRRHGCDVDGRWTWYEVPYRDSKGKLQDAKPWPCQLTHRFPADKCFGCSRSAAIHLTTAPSRKRCLINTQPISRGAPHTEQSIRSSCVEPLS